MKQTSLALAITALLSTLPSAFVQADPNCQPLTGRESDIDIGRNSSERCLPGDNPLQDQQWHLLNTGQDAFSKRGGKSGNDLNLWWAHRTGILGQGINVAVVDDGLAIHHPNLKENIREGSYNFVDGSNDPTPTYWKDAHGTSVGGIIASADNGIGTLGIAPKARLQGYNYLAVQTQDTFLKSHGVDKYPSHDNRIFNQSYGLSLLYPTSINLAPSPNDSNAMHMLQREELLERNTLQGKAAYIKAAGNGFRQIKVRGYTYYRNDPKPTLPFENSNLDSSNTNFWNLVVSAINADGKRSSYSSVGSNVFISAPGGEYGTDSPAIVTTDLPGCDMGYNSVLWPSPNRLHQNDKLDKECNYNGRMNGTSAATPNTSGAMALLMSAYPDLSVRDLRDLLARSATRIDADQQPVMVSYTTNSGRERQVKGLEGWERNAAGMWFSPTYGFGLIDVNKALKMAANHIPLPPLVQLPWQKTYVHEEEAEIPDVGAQPTSSTTNIAAPLQVEAVQVMVNLEHQRLSDLLIELVSPSGTRSILLNPFNSLIGQSLDMKTLGFTNTKGLNDMRLLSNKFYGEQAQGEWRLEVTDVSNSAHQVGRFVKTSALPLLNLVEFNNRKPGKLLNWSLRVLGHDENGN
ncbi:S8 family serine peptidase [Aeromonas finlandensis]|uniref:serine protease Asp n=1 Tax=Aeromonas finlandensis TaxID=1543375 RepID=UPI00051B1810|nr:S8 family serine peptidase [Aeromonas finlandensis]